MRVCCHTASIPPLLPRYAHLDALPLGATVDFKHVLFNVKTQYPFCNLVHGCRRCACTRCSARRRAT